MCCLKRFAVKIYFGAGLVGISGELSFRYMSRLGSIGPNKRLSSNVVF